VNQEVAKDNILPKILLIYIPKQDMYPKEKPLPGQESSTPAAMTNSQNIDIEY